MPARVSYFTDGATFGGAEQVLVSLMRGVDRSRWRPQLIHHREAGLQPLVDEADRLDVPRVVIERTLGEEKQSRWRSLMQLVRHLRSDRPDVFHAQLTWPLAGKYGLLAAVLARVPAIVATLHCHVDVTWRQGLYSQRVIALGVHRYIAVSSHVGQALRDTLRLPRRKISVIHNGIDTRAFERSASADLRKALTGGAERPVVLCVARLDPGKGHRFLVRAAAQVPSATFAFAGDGPELEPLRSEANAIGVADRISFLGHRHDIPDLLASSDVFVLPSLNEGLPLSVLEAMAASRPIVATRVGGTGEAITHHEHGLLVPAADADALAGAIRELLASPELSLKLARRAHARVNQEFRTEVMVDRTTRVYGELLHA